VNTKIKIAAAMVTGLMAGATLVGAAFAAPVATTSPTAYGYGMMSSSGASTTTGTPSFADMNSFMDRYRSSNGSIDFDRMHADVASGAVAMPHVRGAGAARHMSGNLSESGSAPRGSGMMSGTNTTGGSGAGHGMMGSSY
jgi:hypothetical protein